MQIAATKFYKQPKKAPVLFELLSERVFQKTKIDIAYTNYINWERKGLMFDVPGEKGKHNKLNYFDYIWVKIIEVLLEYGFSYSEVIDLKEGMSADLFDEFQIAIKSDPELRRMLNKELSTNLITSDLEIEKCYYPILYWIVMCNITGAERASILITKDNPKAFQLLTESTDKDERLNPGIQNILSKNHLSISMSDIVAKFLIEGDSAYENMKTSILSSKEHSILKIIRNKPENLKSITVKYENQEPVRVDVMNRKKVDIESRFMDHVKRGEYLSIKIETERGGIETYENTKKIKI